MNIAGILELVQKLQKALDLVDLYEIQLIDGTKTDALYEVARELKHQGHKILGERQAVQFTWTIAPTKAQLAENPKHEGKTIVAYLDPFRISRTVEDALQGVRT